MTGCLIHIKNIGFRLKVGDIFMSLIPKPICYALIVPYKM